MVKRLFIFIAIVISLFVTSEAFALKVEYEDITWDEAKKRIEAGIEEKRKALELLKKKESERVDKFFDEIRNVIISATGKLIEGNCLHYDSAPTAFQAALLAKSCQSFLEYSFPGSSFVPLTKSGFLNLGSHRVFYEQGIPKKVEVLGDVEYTAILNHVDLESLQRGKFNATFIVTIKVGQAVANFILSRGGIEQILNISIIYDLTRKLQSNFNDITLKETVLWLNKYYYSVKPDDAKSFILSMLLDLKAQENFINFVIQNQKR